MMNRKLHLAALLAAAITAIAVVGAPARAGTHYFAAVVVNTAAQSAAGYVGDTYSSADGTEMIFCEVRGYKSYAHGYCFARTSAGVWGQCNSTAAPVLQAIQSINGDSAIRFAWDNYGVCNSVIVTNGSMHNPKQPAP